MSIEDHIDKKKTDEEYITLFELIHGEGSFEKRKEEMQKEGPIVNVILDLEGEEITGKDLAGAVYLAVSK